MGTAVGTRRRFGLPRIAAVAAVLAVLLLPVAGAGAQTSTGTDFWLAFPSNLGTPDLTLFVSGAQATSGTVEIPGLEFSQSFDVTPGEATAIPIPADAQLSGNEAILNLGIHVTANDPVSVYGLNRNEVTTDAYLGLPVDQIGTDYIVLGYSDSSQLDNSELAIVGTQDDTTVTITTAAAFDSHAAGEQYQVGLNQGFAYQLTGSEVSGTIISADKPISVFGGATCVAIPANGFACNHLVEQLPPTTEWGTSFATEPLATRDGDTFRILASSDDTSVKVNGRSVQTLDRGQFYETVLTAAAQISADKPVLVMQYANSSSFDGATGDPFEIVVPPTDQFLTRYTVWTPPSGYANYVNVVAPTSDVRTVQLDGSPVGANAFTPIGSSGFSGAQVPIGAGSHTLSGSHAFGVSVYGWADHDGYGYPAGFGTAETAPTGPGGPSASVVQPRSDASVSVTAPAYVRLGSAASFTDTMANAGPNDATGVELHASIPTGSTYVSATLSNGNPCQVNGGSVVCFVGTLPAAGSATATLVFTPGALGSLTQSASLQADYDTNGGNNSAAATTQVIAADAPPPPPPPPAQPGTFNAIGTGDVTVNGQTLTPDTLTLIPSGSTIDLTNGTLTLTDFDHGSGTFGNQQPTPRRHVAALHGWAATGAVKAMVKVDQAATAGAPVTLTLVGGDFTACTAPRRPAAKSQAPVRQLWGQAKGIFTTKGRYSASTIRGTTWLTQDRCDGTLTRAVDDVVDVADLVRKKTVALQPGQSYLAQPASKQALKPPKRKANAQATQQRQTPAAVRKHGLVWGGELFVSKAELAAWLERRGTTWQQFAAKNPALAAALAARG